MKTEFILDGAKIRTLKSFYKEVEREMLLDTNAIKRWSLDVFAEIFEGGYGVYDLNEDILVRWIHFRSSMDYLKPDDLQAILDVFKMHSHVELMVD